MAGLQISRQQAGELSDDVVRRHALTLTRQTDAQLITAAPMPADAPPAAARLSALHAVLRSDLDAKTGPVAKYLAVDLDHCAGQLALALQAGAASREPAAAALMSAAAALGARWLGDERLCIARTDAEDDEDDEDDGDAGDSAADAVWAQPEPREPEELRQWAEASWSGRFQLAARRGRALQVPTRYALRRAIEHGFTAESLRSVADAVFEPAEVDALTRFLTEERELIAGAGLDSRSLGDRRVESLCIAGDLVFGLGRLVRLARAATIAEQPPTTPTATGVPSAGPAAPDADRQFNHLRKALHALAEHPEQ